MTTDPAAPASPRRYRPAGPIHRLLTAALALGLAGLAPAQQATNDADDAAIDAQQEELNDILGPDYQPGFSVLRGNNLEAVDASVQAFHAHLDAGEWEKAFRRLIDLSESTRHVMVPLADSPVYVPIHRSIQQRLRGLPPDGRRAFQQFYDAQARERLAECRNHADPGSEAQLVLARQAYEYFLLSSHGDQIGNLLGDLYFERGRFNQAHQCYEAVLAYHPGTSLPETDLQFKRILALQRAGETARARELADQLAIRLDGRGMRYGGGTADALASIRATLGEPTVQQRSGPARRVPAALPEPGADPVWQMTFANDRTRALIERASENLGYYTPSDLLRLMPVAAVDEQALYVHWHGLAFALDLATGKLLWRTGKFTEVAIGIGQRLNSAGGNPRGYKIALTPGLVLVQTPKQNVRQGGPNAGFALRAYNKQTGELVWDAANLPEWQDHSFCGQPLTVGDTLYAITHTTGLINNQGLQRGGGLNAAPGLLVEDETVRRSARLLTLHRIDPVTGKPGWSVPLGEAEVRAIQYSEFTWMPQPMLAMDGSTVLVLTNNGAVLGVDTVAQEVAWAVRLQVPEGLEQNDFGQTTSPSVNIQNPGEFVRVGGRLYVKEAWSRRVYILDPDTARLLGEDEVPAHTSLIGADPERMYLMSSAVRAYPADGQGRMLWNNSQINSPGTGSGILTDDTLYVLGGNKLRALAIENGDPSGEFTSRLLRGNGGTLMMAGDLLVCITDRDVTAFQVPTEPAPQYTDAPGELP